MDYYRPFPNYPGYQPYRNWDQISEDRVIEDLEYLQQMYPMYAKRYQARVRDILDRMDYQGSVIYDQYPDKWQAGRELPHHHRPVPGTVRRRQYKWGGQTPGIFPTAAWQGPARTDGYIHSRRGCWGS